MASRTGTKTYAEVRVESGQWAFGNIVGPVAGTDEVGATEVLGPNPLIEEEE